ncbi:tetratricopeptide repeat protein [Occallatibacter savannae]|uniref:tetratricopeptide repeat protein n=1 Tax=Occallatibacter savannae TaxID=1002691 RepID=UPI000D68BACF|nr:tetratricopeptide repeat protein [Occallatibacter savannae]
MPGPTLRFNDIELDVGRFEIRRNGRSLRLERLPMELLILLVSRQGELVTREEVVSRLWGEGVHLDADQGINTAIRKIRMCLRDTPENPAYIQTVVGKGYRFIPTVEVTRPGAVATPEEVPHPNSSPDPRPDSTLPATPPRIRKWVAAAALVMVAVAAALGALWYARRDLHPPAIKAIAVLPFDNLSADPAQDYFVDGVTDELVTELARMGGVRVISRTSSMQYKHAKGNLKNIAGELGVDAIVEGAVARSGNRVRITAQLIRASTDQHLWADSYERDVSDILAVQTDIAAAVARELRIQLALQTPAAAQPRPLNQEAYAEYLRGRYAWNLRREPAILEAIQHFESAIRIDPNFAQAYSALADCHTTLGYLNARSPEETFPNARLAAQKALELDSSLAEPHASLAYYDLYYARDWQAAETEFRKAIELNPNYALAHDWYGVYLTARQRWNDALVEIRKARELDPLSLPISTDEGFSLYYAGNYDGAIRSLRETLARDPGFPLAHLWLGRAYEEKGMYPEAIGEFQQVQKALPGWPVAIAAAGWVYGRWGKSVEARQALADLNATSAHRYVSSYAIALVHSGLGEKEQTLQLLDRGLEERTNWMVWAAVDPRWQLVRGDERFQTLLRKVGP